MNYKCDEEKSEGSDEKKSEEEKTTEIENEEEQLASNETKPEKKGCSNDEILAVLAHELGHWKGSHVLKQFVLTQVSCVDATFLRGCRTV